MLGSKVPVESLPEIRGDVFKVTRERLSIRPEDLGARVCLSKKYILQLEAGGGSCFFSEEHKISVAKKVAKLLHLEEEQFLIYRDGTRDMQASLPFEGHSELSNVSEDVAKQEENTKKSSLRGASANHLGGLSNSFHVSHLFRQSMLRWLLIGAVFVGLYMTKGEIMNLLVDATPTPAPSQAIETINLPADSSVIPAQKSQ